MSKNPLKRNNQIFNRSLKNPDQVRIIRVNKRSGGTLHGTNRGGMVGGMMGRILMLLNMASHTDRHRGKKSQVDQGEKKRNTFKVCKSTIPHSNPSQEGFLDDDRGFRREVASSLSKLTGNNLPKHFSHNSRSDTFG
jgi:hypothetical protein